MLNILVMVLCMSVVFLYVYGIVIDMLYMARNLLVVSSYFNN